MRKLFRSRRAVSPVVSAVLMMLIVMIGMSLLFAFFVNYTRGFQTGSGSAVLESMVIEDVKFTDSDTTIWVYNIGKVELKIASVYVNNTVVSSSPTLLQVTYKGQDIVPVPSNIRDGAHGEITIRPFQSGQSYIFKIVTERGTSVEGEYRG
jgi:FlaG/FlaF family flagellin (archaellin)